MDNRQQKQLSTMASSLLVQYLTVSFRVTADTDSSFQPGIMMQPYHLTGYPLFFPLCQFAGRDLLPFFSD